MSEAKTIDILTRFEAGQITEAGAVKELVRSGVGRVEAAEMVFIASGGSDVIDLNRSPRGA